MPEAEQTVVNAIRKLLRRRSSSSETTPAEAAPVDRDADLYEDLELDSLEVAELSATLEDDLGSDPYSEGITPRTVGEVVDYYENK